MAQTESRWDEYLGELVGKTIRGVVLKERDGAPRSQLFLLFDDGSFEFYSTSDEIRPTRGDWPGSGARVDWHVRTYLAGGSRTVAEAHERRGAGPEAE